jgi:chromosome segregation ATPase
MIKKLIFAGVGVAALATLVFGTSIYSYVRTTAGYVKDGMAETVPVDFQIDRARGLIQDLVPEVKKNMHVIAKEEVEVQRLDEQIAQHETRLAKEREQILKLKTDLSENRVSYNYGGRSYAAAEVRQDLANRFERFKTGEATLASLKQIRSARDKSLSAARQKLEGMLAAKRQLQVEVENLQARSQMIAAAKTTSSYQFDDSRLGNVKELIADLKARMEVSEKLVNAEANFHDEIPLEKAVPENIEEQITQYFMPNADKQVTMTEKK